MPDFLLGVLTGATGIVACYFIKNLLYKHHNRNWIHFHCMVTKPGQEVEVLK